MCLKIQSSTLNNKTEDKNMTNEEFELGLVRHFGIGGIFGDRTSWEKYFADCGFGC